MNQLKYLLKPPFFCLLLCGVLCVSFVRARTIDPESIRKAYQRFVELPQLENGLVSLTVLDAKTGSPVFSEHGHLGMATASTLKNITAATAFHVLGADYKFRTTLSIRGDIDEAGVLHGDLIVTGTGDPSLGSDRYDHTKESLILEKWVRAVQEAGIRSIAGRIIADDLLYGGYQAPNGWPWSDMGNYYGAGVSSLNWRENAFGVVFKPGSKAGEPTAVGSTTADLSYLDMVNEVITGNSGSGDNVYGYSAPYSTRIFFRGSHGLDLKKTIVMSVPDPAYDLSFQLWKQLEKAGVTLNGMIGTAYGLESAGESFHAETRRVIDIHESPELSELIYWFNQSSINLYGESLLKAMANHLGEEHHTGSISRWVGDFWSEKLGIPRGELRIVDGSGLSPNNRVTTLAMARVLAACQEEPWFAEFLNSIPTNNGMKLKSGTIGGVLGYAGYHTARDGSSYIIALLVSNYGGGASAMRRNMFSMLDVLK